jgi:hypothetical protein
MAPELPARRLFQRFPAALGPVVATALVAAAVHLAVRTPEVISDARLYEFIARGLLGDPEVPVPLEGLAVRGYLYPVFIAVLYAIAHTPEIVVLVQGLVLLPLTTLLVYVAGREAFSRRTGLIAAWGFALWLPAAWQTNLLLTETMLALLLAALLALLAATLARGTRNLALGAGATAAIVSVAHPAYQFLWLVVLLAAVAIVRRREVVTPMAIGMATIVVPYAALVLVGAPRLGQGDTPYSGSGGGWNFYVGSRAETNFTAVPSDYVVWHNRDDLGRVQQLERAGLVEMEPRLAAAIERKLASPEPSERRLTDADYWALGREHLLAAPENWPAKLRRGAATILLFPRDPRVLGTPGAAEVVWWRDVWRPFSFGLLLLALGGLVYVLARRRDRLLLFVPGLAAVFAFSLVHAEPRYGVPLWPALFLLAALPVSLVWERVAAGAQRLQTETVPRS